MEKQKSFIKTEWEQNIWANELIAKTKQIAKKTTIIKVFVVQTKLILSEIIGRPLDANYQLICDHCTGASS